MSWRSFYSEDPRGTDRHLWTENHINYHKQLSTEVLFEDLSTAEEEAYYIRMLREGTVEEARQAKEILVERNLRLVAHIAKKYQNVEEDMEDLISIGCIGLIKAVNSFDSGKGRLATYACRCIDNELLMMLRSRKKLSREVSLYEPIGQDKEGNAIHLLDVIEEKQRDVVEDLEFLRNRKRLLVALDHCLTEREYKILVMRYGILGYKEYTQQEVGDALGISRSYVSRMEKKALQKLAAELKEE